jgi:HSP20 family protein
MKMNDNNNIMPIDNWFNRILNLRNRWWNEGFGNDSRSLFDTTNLFRGFDDMHREMNSLFNVFNDISTNAPKELVREYQTSDGAKVREVGPIVYGYSMTIGPDGKPKIREFGNVKSPFSGKGFFEQPSLSAEREPLIDISSTDKEVKIVAEMPGISKEKIKIDAYDKYVEIESEDPNRKYHKTIEIPDDIDIESARSNYNNGVLEITFQKKEQQKPKSRQINIE